MYFFLNHFVPKLFFNPQSFFSKQGISIICATFQGNYFIKISSFSCFFLCPNQPFLGHLCLFILSMILSLSSLRHLHHSDPHPLYCFHQMLYCLLMNVLSLQHCYCFLLNKHVRIYITTTY